MTGASPALVDGLLEFRARWLMDEDGRPVAEVAAPAFREVTTELVRCPYADARAGGVMNRSALTQMGSVWPELLACFAYLAGRPAPATGQPRGPTVGEAWAAAITGIALPLVDFQNSLSANSGSAAALGEPTPRLIAGLFKASLGLSQVFSAMLLTGDGVADAPLTALGDAPAFFAALDAGRWLVGAEQVCAGTRPMIEAVFEALAGDGRSGGSAAGDAAGNRGPAGAAIGAATALTARLDPGFIGLVERASAAPTIVGLHVAHLCAVQAAARRGDGEAIVLAHPWLRVVYAIPDRPPEHARRLFPAGEAPGVLERYLEAVAGEPSRAHVDRAWEAAVGPAGVLATR